MGFGLHFCASGEDTGRGYGFGKSYLVWLTRDTSFYKSTRTYLQLYRSSDDVQMAQIASVSISDRIDSPVDVKVLYNREGKVVEVMVDGETKLIYEVETVIQRGDKVVLRTLGGPVVFTHLAVKTQ